MNMIVWVVMILLVVALIIYAIALVLAFIVGMKALESFKTTVQSNPIINIGLPVSALSSFCIVSVFWKVFPPQTSSGEPLSLRFVGLNFTGPSGPITLWFVCFLAIVLAMKLFSSPPRP